MASFRARLVEGLVTGYFDAGTHLPRAVGSPWRVLLNAYGQSPERLVESEFDLRKAEFHPAAALRVTEEQLTCWRSALLEWAYAHGFPKPLNTERRIDWDVSLGARLYEDTNGLPEAFHPDVWCWMATHLLPHFVVYRWGWPPLRDGAAPLGRAAWARFGSTLQNGLRLALHRVATYGPELARRASEQEFQSVQNRPAFGRDQRVARVILQTLVEAADDESSRYGRDDGGGRALDADRVCTELRLINSLQPFCFATDDELRQVVLDVINRLPELRRTYRKVRTWAPPEPASRSDGEPPQVRAC